MTMQSRRPQGGLVKVEIDFIGGSRALKMFTQLRNLMPLVREALRNVGCASQARILFEWQKTVDYRIDRNPQSWVMELNGEQWQALSRGLRLIKPKGLSFMAWINRHSTNEYPDGEYKYSPTYRRSNVL